MVGARVERRRAVTGYFVFLGTTTGGQSPTPVNPSPIPANTTSYGVTGLTNGTRYYFVVKAINARGLSPASGEESTTPRTAARSTHGSLPNPTIMSTLTS